MVLRVTPRYQTCLAYIQVRVAVFRYMSDGYTKDYKLELKKKKKKRMGSALKRVLQKTLGPANTTRFPLGVHFAVET